MDAVDIALTNEANGYSSFDADYTPSPETIDLVNRVFAYIETNPEKWDQANYGNHLSETNCFMGIVCRLSGMVTRVPTWHEESDKAEDFNDYMEYQAMDILKMDGDDHADRADYIALFIDVPSRNYDEPTLDEMRERVSIAMGHDFRKSPECRCPALLDCECA